MNPSEIDHSLQALIPHRYGWRCQLPREAVTFAGHPVGLNFETSGQPVDGAPPKPDDVELKLARLILDGLAAVVASAEELLRQRLERENDEQVLEIVSNPHIWIAREAIEMDGPTRWAFVIERFDAPDFGYHVEYDGTERLHLWAGD